MRLIVLASMLLVVIARMALRVIGVVCDMMNGVDDLLSVGVGRAILTVGTRSAVTAVQNGIDALVDDIARTAVLALGTVRGFPTAARAVLPFWTLAVMASRC